MMQPILSLETTKTKTLNENFEEVESRLQKLESLQVSLCGTQLVIRIGADALMRSSYSIDLRPAIEQVIAERTSQ